MFGVFIRSVGERTEQLCLESCRQCIPHENVRIIKNKFPAYNAFIEMFKQAKELDYEWYLGVDADIVLVPNWYEIALQKKKEMEKSEWFAFTVSVMDKFLGKIDRGNHFYNGKHTEKSLEILKTKTKHMLKPESKIRHYVKHNNTRFNDLVIGYHGYEQFFCDIFYRFWMQAKRDRKLEKKYLFLKKGSEDNVLEDIDFSIAQKGWNIEKKKNRISYWLHKKYPSLSKKIKSDASLRKRLFSEHIKNMQEKDPLSLSLEMFLKNVNTDESVDL